MPRASHVLTALLVCCTCAAAPAGAARSVQLDPSFTPERLGHGATVSFGVQLGDARGGLAPLTEVAVRYPAGLQIGLSGLGLDTCTQQRLEAVGPRGCPSDSLMGDGSAVTEMPVGPSVVREQAQITIVRGPEREGHFTMLFYAAGVQPVIVKAVFTGLLLPAGAPYGGVIRIELPVIQGLPGSNIAVVRLHVELGPPQLTYYERVRGKLVAYHPKRIALPERCPRGGFPFSATLAFLDGSRAEASTRVRCPRRAARSTSTRIRRA